MKMDLIHKSAKVWPKILKNRKICDKKITIERIIINNLIENSLILNKLTIII